MRGSLMKNDFDEKSYLMFNFLVNDTQALNYAVTLTSNYDCSLHSFWPEWTLDQHTSYFIWCTAILHKSCTLYERVRVNTSTCVFVHCTFLNAWSHLVFRPRKDLFTFETCTVVKELLFSNELQAYENVQLLFFFYIIIIWNQS